VVGRHDDEGLVVEPGLVQAREQVAEQPVDEAGLEEVPAVELVPARADDEADRRLLAGGEVPPREVRKADVEGASSRFRPSQSSSGQRYVAISWTFIR
jgi:methylmalonyl-CoA mutase cobalamin-binding subunit